MKKQSNTLFATLTTVELQDLTSVKDESLAIDIYKSSNKIFSAAHLWNIQRQGKRRVQRRYQF